MSIAVALAELERSPELYDHLAHLQAFIADEQQRREQFHREYEGRRGEFINGQICVSPSATLREMEAAGCIMRLLHTFAGKHGIGEALGGKCLVHCQRNDYEPDVCFFSATKAAVFTDDMFLFPPPDLAVEVLSASTVDNDRKLKWRDYARHGVGEYWIVDSDDRIVEQYVLPPGAATYQLKARLPEGARLTSAVLTGFSVPVAAFFEQEEHLRLMQSFLASPED